MNTDEDRYFRDYYGKYYEKAKASYILGKTTARKDFIKNHPYDNEEDYTFNPIINDNESLFKVETLFKKGDDYVYIDYNLFNKDYLNINIPKPKPVWPKIWTSGGPYQKIQLEETN